MRRRQDWPERLYAFIEERRDMPFQWGQNDCVLFAADGIQRMTGEDVLGDLRGQWTSASEAARLLSSLGGMEAVADGKFERVERDDARRGDLALMTVGSRESFGLLTYGDVIGPGEDHIIINPPEACRVIWKVAR